MEMLYDNFADIPSLEGEKGKIISMFNEIKTGIIELNKLGIKFNASNSIKEVDELSITTAAYNKELGNMQKQVLVTTAKLATLTGEEANQIESLKQVTSLTKQLSSTEVKNTVIRQAAYSTLKEGQLANQELNKSITQRIKIRNTEATSEIGLQLRYDKTRAILKKLSDEQRNSFRGQALEKFAQSTKRSLDLIQQRVGDFRGNVGNYANSLADGFEIVRREIARLQTQADKLRSDGDPTGAARIEGNIRQLDDVIKISYNTNQSYAKSVKQIEKEYQNLAASGNHSLEFLEEFKKFAAESKDAAADLKDEIKALSSDTRGLDLAVGSIQTVASVFEAGAGAAALFGANTEDVEKVTQRLVAVQSIANGVREVGEQITKRGTAANLAYNFVLKQSQLLFGANTTAALRFQAAINSIGIVALITGIAMLATKLGILGGAEEEAQKRVDELTEAFERQQKAIDNINKSIDHNTKIDIAKLKENAASKETIYEREVQALRDKVAAEEEQHLLSAKAEGDYQRKILIAKRFGISTTNLRNELKLIQENSEKLRVATVDAQNNLDEFIAENAAENAEERREKQKKIRDKAIEDGKAYYEREKENELKLYIFRKNLIKESADIQSGEGSPLGQNKRIEQAKIAAQAETDILKKQYEYDLKQKDVTASGKLLIEETYSEDLVKIQQALSRKIADIYVQEIQARKDADEESIQLFYDTQKQKEDIAREFAQKQNDNELTQIQKQRDESIELNIKNLEAGLITKEQYEKRKLKIEEDFQRITLETQIRFYEAQAALMKANGEDTLELDAAIAKARADLASNRLTSSVDQAEKEKKIIEETKQNYLDAFQAIGEAFSNVMGGIAEARKAQLQDQIDKNEELKAAEIDRITKSSKSDEEKAAKIKVIEANAQIRKEALERKQRNIDRQQAIQERAMKIFQVGTDTIVGVNKIKLLIAAAPDPITKALYTSQLTLAYASGAVALTSLIAAKLPGFYTGTDNAPAGPAKVAERGRELAKEPSGKFKLFNHPHIANLQAGTQIYPNDVTEDILRSSTRDIVHPTIYNIKENRDNRTEKEILGQLKEINKKSGIRIYNNPSIESTAWYDHQFKN